MGDCNTLNQAKVITCQALLQEGFITQEQFNRFVCNYAFVIRKKGMFDKIMERIWGTPQGDTNHFDLIKMVVADDNQAEALRIVESINKVEKKIQAEVVQQLDQDRFERIGQEEDR